MAKPEIVHSQQACTVIVKGDKSRPEPIHIIVKFPGGEFELTRRSDNQSYWAHVHINEGAQIVDSRIDYDFETSLERTVNGQRQIDDIADAKHMRKFAFCVHGQYVSTDDL